jgi:protein ImuB
MRRVLSLFLPNFPTDRRHLHNASLKANTRPLLTVARQGSRRVVVAADARAQALGVSAGMAVAQAQALLPDLHIEESDPAGDEAALHRLAGWCLRHISPLAAPCDDGVFIDVTGCTHFYANGADDGEAPLLDHLIARMTQTGFTARAAIADTPGAAHALARYGDITIAPPGSPPKIFAHLPAAALRLTDETLQTLRKLGFDTIGQIMAAPRAPLAKRFGTTVLGRLDQLLGHAAEPIEPILIPEIPRARLGFPEPIATPEDLARAIKLLCESLCEKCLQRGLGVRQLDLVFARVDGANPTLRIGTAAANRDSKHLSRLLIEHLETIDPGFGIEHMLLTASFTDQLGARQTLSDLRTETSTGDLASLVDALANRLGPQKIFRLTPVESDVPERATKRIPLLSRPRNCTWPEHLPRPPRLFTPPQNITVITLLPAHAPKQFTWRRRPYRVQHADGPERIFGEWWKNEAERWAVRDYFSVEDTTGQRFWLFRRGDGEHALTGDYNWFLHGIFA